MTPAPVLDGHKGLRRATWEWTFETGSHALRIIFGGVFDRFPRAKLALGHLGETLPFLLWRFDSRAGPGFYAVKLAKLPSQYIKDNIVVATSGMCSAEPLTCTISALGHDHVMFAADYPFEVDGRSGAFHRWRRDRRGHAKGYLLQHRCQAAEIAGMRRTHAIAGRKQEEASPPSSMRQFGACQRHHRPATLHRNQPKATKQMLQSMEES